MRLFSLLFLMASGLISACQAQDSAQVNGALVPRFEPVGPNGEFPVQVPPAFDSTLGWLVVREDRTDPNSAEIRLPVAIVHGRSEDRRSPVVYLAGGPGTSAMRTAAFPGAYPWLADRDFIVFGHRGTHFAQPALMCPEYREAVADGSQLIDSVRNCRERLLEYGVDLDQYNSVSIAADLEDLRTTLGITTWNLYGGSYGTRLALTYAKTYGDSIDAMVLDSPLPPNAIYDDQSAENLEAALRAVARDCAQQVACDAAFPDLENRFFQTLDEVSRSPIELEGVGEAITAPSLAAFIPLGSESSVRQAPLAMDLVARRDPSLLRSATGPWQAVDFAWGMRFSVWCSEALPFSNRLGSGGPREILGGYESAAISPEICNAWGVAPLDADFVEPVSSDVPTLIIAGEFDHLTPPRWGELAAQTLPNSLAVTVRGGSHSSTQQWGGDGCAMALASEFIDTPERVLRSPDATDCLSNRPAPEYALNRD